MCSTETCYQHIVLDEAGVPIIEGTAITVRDVVLDHVAYGLSAEEIHFKHKHLTIGQIHSALAYYWDHQGDIDNDIVASLQQGDRQVIDNLRSIAKPPSLWERLRTQGVI